MKECLVYLTHLDPEDTQAIMMSKLEKLASPAQFTFEDMNTLSWAVGSISGALREAAEKRFLVHVIKELLNLCESKRGKNEKALVAGDIMYVCGSYPRFLKGHWRFLKTVINKLFDFMHELHPGVQEMACDTFLTIAKKCKGMIASIQPGEPHAFIEEIIMHLPQILSDLPSDQIHTFYEALGFIIRADSRADLRQKLVLGAMELPNQSWARMMAIAGSNPQCLFDSASIRDLKTIIRSNNRFARSLGEAYIVQISRIFMELLQLYQVYSTQLSETVQKEGPRAAETSLMRGIRSLKSEIIELLKTFVSACGNTHKQYVVENFLPPLMEHILQDYKRSIPIARDSQVLLLLSTIMDKLGETIVHMVPQTLSIVFPCTVEMITANFEDFPDHRVNFFTLLRTINKKCFRSFFDISAEDFQMVYDSITWAMRHLERTVAETGLQMLSELLANIEKHGEIRQTFYQRYLLVMLQDTLGVMTDTMHKAGFHLQNDIVRRIVNLISSGSVQVPLWTPEQGSFPNNAVFVRHWIANIFAHAFPNMAS
jgi:exportin-1